MNGFYLFFIVSEYGRKSKKNTIPVFKSRNAERTPPKAACLFINCILRYSAVNDLKTTVTAVTQDN